MDNQYPEAFRAYLMSLNKAAHTVKQYVNDAKKFERFIEEHGLRGEFSESLKRYIDVIYTNYQTANSINRKLAAIRSYCVFLYSRKYIPVYDETLFELREIEPKKLAILSEAELRKVLNQWDVMYQIAETEEHAWIAMRNLAMTYTIAELGIKPAELVKMKWRHIDDIDSKVTILERQTFRVLDVSKGLLAIWQRYKAETAQFFDQLDQLDDMWLGVGNKLGEPITVKTVERVFLQLSKLINLKVTCTMLRYTAIDKLMQQHDSAEVFTTFGYAKPAVLVERYKRLDK